MRDKSERIAVLDGVRAYAILIVMGFHLWQQSWLQNLIPHDLLQPFGVQDFSLTWVPRTGYMFVDVLLLLSGFCLFLPYARQMADPLAREPDAPGLFFQKRAARILPSYYFCLLVSLLFLVRPAQYARFGDYLLDLFAHLTCTHTLWPQSYIGTKFPGVLWTLSVEVQFYLIFPLLARLFRRFPLQCWAVLSALAQLYIALFARTPGGGADPLHINQLPAMLGVYANGMLAAIVWCRLHSARRGLPARTPLALLMLDLDFFKNYNDRFGHQAGDAALKAVAQATQKALLRDSDKIFRYGGEEFTTILAGAGQYSAMTVAQRILEEVTALDLVHPDSRTGKLTVSIGIAHRSFGEDADICEVLTHADQALYEAKTSGRNRIVLFEG